MIERLWISLGVALLLGLFGLGCSITLPAAVSDLEGLQLVVTAERPTLLLGEPLDIEVRVENQGTAPFIGSFDLSAGSNFLTIFTALEGAEFNEFSFPISSQRTDKAITSTTLAPGEGLGGTLTLAYDVTLEDWVFSSPGIYLVKAKLAADPATLDDTIESDVVFVTVTQPEGVDGDALTFIIQNGLERFLSPLAGAFLGIDEAVPLLLELVDKFPTSRYATFVREALRPLASRFPALLLKPPEVALTADQRAGTAPLIVTFTAQVDEGSTDIAEEYLWDFDGDAISDESTPEGAVTHTFSELGTFPVSVLVIDGSNLTAVDSVIVATRPGFHLGFEPTHLVLPKGEDNQFRVVIVPVSRGLSAVEVELSYDSSVLQLTNIEVGDVLGPDPLVAVKRIDYQSGKITLAVARAGVTTSPSTAGTLATITIKAAESAISGTASAVEFTNVTLVNEALTQVANEDMVSKATMPVGIP